MKGTAVAIVLLLCFVYQFNEVSTTTPREQAKITSLPGLTFTPNFEQYSGYITLPGTTKNIFYWFVTSQNSPKTDPFVLWLNGGPGCSDLGDGLFLENGPYYPYATSSQTVNLTSNYYTWNKVANMLYIESPCGVGFSYGEYEDDYKSNDNVTAFDNYLFLDGFFALYPEYEDNTFWIVGESYAGIYITTLAYQIFNNGSNVKLQNNLMKGGLMLGNPVTNCYGDNGPSFDSANIIDMNTQINLYYWHGMMSRRDYDNWNTNQCNSTNPPSLSTCADLFIQYQNTVGTMYQPTATSTTTMSTKREEKELIGADTNTPINPDMLYFDYCTGNGTLDFLVDEFPDCFDLDAQISTYLNSADTQEAIHAKPPKTEWKECGGVLYNKTVGSVIPYLTSFFANQPTMRILYYAGDVDISTVPFAQTQVCLETMNRPIVEKWRPFTVNKEVAGYVEVYDTYTFALIKGGGHEAPIFKIFF